jgi:hypothetical protein
MNLNLRVRVPQATGAARPGRLRPIDGAAGRPPLSPGRLRQATGIATAVYFLGQGAL